MSIEEFYEEQNEGVDKDGSASVSPDQTKMDEEMIN